MKNQMKPTSATLCATSIDAREWSILTAHLGLATAAAQRASFDVVYAPGSHAWSPPRC